MADAPLPESATQSEPPAVPPALKLLRGTLRVLSAVAPPLAARMAADLFMKPRRFTTPERERAATATATSFTVATGPSRSIEAWSWGEGPNVFLVHGWEGRGSQLSAFAAPLVAAGFRVIAWDAPGHGGSSGKRSSLVHFAWGIREMAEAVGEPYAVIAHSLGCAATTLAVHEGVKAERLVFIAPPLEPSDYTARFGEILGISERTLERMKFLIEERFLRKWSDYSLATLGKKMRVPLLVIHDIDDRDTFLWESEGLVAAWPGSRLVKTAGLGHRRILRDPSVLAMATEFITRR